MFPEFETSRRRGVPLIIAELGAKYAEIPVMRGMIESAASCGADMVKFQTYNADRIVMPGSWFTFEDGSRVAQQEFFRKYELTEDDHRDLIGHCGRVGIGWLSTPSSPEDVDLLETFDPCCYKTGSDDLTNLPFLRYIADRGRPMIVSTGMCTLGEVERAVESIVATGNRRLVLLHCVVSYPSRPEDANLMAIETLKKAFGFPVGLSDHTADEFTSILATQMGAVIIEKHFTPDHAMKMPDHEASLDPVEFRRLVERVHLVPKALGTGVKEILETERKWRVAARKSIVSRRDIGAGQTIAATDLDVRRPADGMHPHHLDLVIGRVARRDIPAGTLITPDMI